MATPISLKSPLSSKDLFLESMAATSGLSVLGETQLGLLSEKADVKSEDLLGKPMTVELILKDGAKRHFNGLVTRFGIGAHRGRYYGYQATIRPWLWFLTRTADCRIFQAMSVPDIVKKVFDDHPAIAQFEFKLFRSYRQWVYCVQYRETDYNFVARLLEHEGIYWYFEHTADQHKLILVDSHTAHDPAPGCDSLPYYENADQVPPDTEYVSNWSSVSGVRSGKAASTSYDFERPATSLLVESKQARGHALDDYELFDFQGDYVQAADGTQYDDDRLTEQQASYGTTRGASNGQGILVGHVLTIEKHPRDDQNAKYLIVSQRVDAHADGYEGGSGDATAAYQCTFEAIPAAQQYRPPRQTPKPFVQGPQTAIVVGPSGEEIYTDKYGRVKVQFHWDRYGKNDEKSSCWMRVSHPWAGKNFGVMHIPRIGQEVVVDFLEGDPDQPLITGRVYNAMQMPPWDLPANATQSGILTRSSKGGGVANANAIRFEDKKGSEQLWIHAEKNQDIEVEHDETHWVGHDRKKNIDHDETTHVKHDRTETVDNNETITIHGARTEVVDKDETITIHQNRTETVNLNEKIAIGVDRTESVGSNEKITIGSSRSITVGASETATVTLQRTHSVGVNETITVGAAQEVTVGGMQAVTVGGLQAVTVGLSQTTNVGVSQSTSVGTNRTIDVGANQASNIGSDFVLTAGGKLAVKAGSDEAREVGGGRGTKVANDDSLSIGKKLVIDAGDEVSITTGDASIVMKKDGSISIKGKDIVIDASGKIDVKASSNLIMSGSKITQN